jgi:hypothetical protein
MITHRAGYEFFEDRKRTKGQGSVELASALEAHIFRHVNSVSAMMQLQSKTQ